MALRGAAGAWGLERCIFCSQLLARPAGESRTPNSALQGEPRACWAGPPRCRGAALSEHEGRLEVGPHGLDVPTCSSSVRSGSLLVGTQHWAERGFCARHPLPADRPSRTHVPSSVPCPRSGSLPSGFRHPPAAGDQRAEGGPSPLLSHVLQHQVPRPGLQASRAVAAAGSHPPPGTVSLLPLKS